MKYVAACILFLSVSLMIGTGMTDEMQTPAYTMTADGNLCEAPNGRQMGTLVRGTRISVLETEGIWSRVSVQGWVRTSFTPEDTAHVSSIAPAGTVPVLELVGFETKHLPVSYEDSRYCSEAILTLMVRNNSPERITAWKTLLIVRNTFGDLLFRAPLTDGAADISPGATAQSSFRWEDNRFVTDEPYDKLVSFAQENLKLELSEVQLSR